MDSLVAFLRELGAGRIAAMGAVGLGLIGFFAFLMMQMTAPQMSYLFTGLDIDDSGSIVTRLEAMEVPYEISGGGTAILIPDNRVLRLRMILAEEGLPTGGNVGYEIFDNADALGSTSFLQNLNHLRALEGELARTIRSLDRVQAARVHLVLPKREIFSREKQKPSAAIILKVRGGELAAPQVRSIQHLVASAVPGLMPSQVSMVDESGRLLANGMDDKGPNGMSGGMDERNHAYEERLRHQVLGIVNSVVGPEKARVQITADLDFNRITQSEEIYDPDGQVVRSTQTVEENSADRDADLSGAVTVSENLPGAGEDSGDSESGIETTKSSSRLEETVNYEISRTTRTEVIEAGRIKRISVAVLVDGTYTAGANGASQYAAQSQEVLDKVSRLVKSAIGFDQSRGDTIEVINLRFAKIDLGEPLIDEEASWLNLTKADYMRIGEMTALSIIGLLLVLLVLRPLVSGIIAPGPVMAVAGGATGALVAEQAPAQLTGPADSPDGETSLDLLSVPKESDAAKMIDIAQVEGQVKASSVKKVAEIVNRHPEEALSIVRRWLHEES